MSSSSDPAVNLSESTRSSTSRVTPASESSIFSMLSSTEEAVTSFVNSVKEETVRMMFISEKGTDDTVSVSTGASEVDSLSTDLDSKQSEVSFSPSEQSDCSKKLWTKAADVIKSRLKEEAKAKHGGMKAAEISDFDVQNCLNVVRDIAVDLQVSQPVGRSSLSTCARFFKFPFPLFLSSSLRTLTLTPPLQRRSRAWE